MRDLCPCITSSLQGPADYERCQVPLICKTGLAFDNTGKNGHFREFAWQG